MKALHLQELRNFETTLAQLDLGALQRQADAAFETYRGVLDDDPAPAPAPQAAQEEEGAPAPPARVNQTGTGPAWAFAVDQIIESRDPEAARAVIRCILRTSRRCPPAVAQERG